MITNYQIGEKTIKSVVLKLPLVVESFFFLFLSTILIAFVPHYLIIGIFRKTGIKLHMEPFEKKKEKAIKIGRTIEKITPRLPWKCTCMVKALSACLMLYIRRIPHRLFIGVRRDKDGIIQAHAWLCFGHVVITGGKEYDTYNKMSSIE